MGIPLYRIADQYRITLELMHQDDIGVENSEYLKQLAQDTLDSLNISELDKLFDEKILAVAAFTKEVFAESEAVKNVEETLRKRRKRLEFLHEYMRDYMSVQLQKVGKSSVKNNEIVISLRKTPGRIVIDKESEIPPEYIETQTITNIRKNWMLDKLKSGEVDSIPGVHMETGFTLSMR
jgi:hypothetical protein